MFSPPAVVVHGLAQARDAMRPGLPVTLLSAPGAACYAGCAWWRQLVVLAQAEFAPPDASDANAWPDILDCADAPGHALAALRIGQRSLILDPHCPGFGSVLATAERLQARLLSERPPSLDLAERGALRRLDTWLARSLG